MKNEPEARQRTKMLVELRRKNGERAKRAQELLKKQQAVRRMLRHAMQVKPHSVPELARQTGLSAHDVLWNIAAMKKYGLVEEAGMDESGDYYLYALSKEAKA